jgi:hypothetical protein
VLGNHERGKPTRRLLAAIGYENGVRQIEIPEWYDIARRTIYSGLMALETDEPLDHAVVDQKRT